MKITAEDFQSMVCTFPPYEVIYSRVQEFKFTNSLSVVIEILKQHEQVLKELGCTSVTWTVVDGVAYDHLHLAIYGRRQATESERLAKKDFERNMQQAKRAKLREDLFHYQKRIEDIQRELGVDGE